MTLRNASSTRAFGASDSDDRPVGFCMVPVVRDRHHAVQPPLHENWCPRTGRSLRPVSENPRNGALCLGTVVV